MTRYIVRRLLNMIPLLLLVSLISFAIMRLAPGGPDKILLGAELQAGIDTEKIAQIRAEWGLDKSIPEQYVTWLKNMLKGDLGRSYFYRMSASDLIKSAIVPTLELQAISLLFIYLIALPLGVISAVRQYSLLDHVLTTVAFVTYAAPSYFIGLLLIYWVAMKLGKAVGLNIPTNGRSSIGISVASVGWWAYFVDRARYLFLPLLTTVTGGMAGIIRYMRSSMLEVLKEDYIRTARSKGLADRVVIYKHALRNALLPIITLSGSLLAALIGGSVIVERIFSWPGLGRIAFDSVNSRDYNVAMAITMLTAVMTLAAFLLVDIVYVIVDPRIKYE